MKTTIFRSRNTIIALALAALATLFTMLYVSKATGKDKPVVVSGGTAFVYVAKSDIAAGTPTDQLLARKLIVRRPVSKASVVPGSITRQAELRGLVIGQPIYAGEQVTARRLTVAQALGVLAQLKGSARAIQIAGDANQLLVGTLKSGDHVDLLVSMHYPESGQLHYTKIVLRNLLVLRAPSATPGSSSQSYSATLQVGDTQVQKFYFAIRNTDWTFVLRPVLKPYDDSDNIQNAATVLGLTR